MCHNTFQCSVRRLPSIGLFLNQNKFLLYCGTQLRKGTGVFESFRRFIASCFIGLMCHNYALRLFIYTYAFVCDYLSVLREFWLLTHNI